MQKDQIQDFTRRLSQCNRGQMIVIMYDIYFSYSSDAKICHTNHDYKGFKDAVHKALGVLNRLIEDLNFAYEISDNLYQLYCFSRNELSKSIYQNKLDGIEHADKVLKNLYAGFVEAAKQDQSEPLMRNTQPVYAGMTYGRTNLNENYRELDQDRGFFV